MRVYDGANWIAATSAGNVSLILYEYTATAGQTTFSGSDDNSATLSYTADNLQVVMNGIVLDPSDFTATNGTSVVLASGAALNDIVNIYAFKSFTTADMVSKTAGGTFSGAVGFSGGITGDVAFDTSTLKVDSSNNRVAIGTTSTSAGQVTIQGSGSPRQLVITDDGAEKLQIFQIGNDATIEAGSGGSDSTNLIFKTASSGTESEAMRIDSSGKVGIGTSSPSVPLHLSTSSSGDIGIFNTSANGGTGLFINSQTAGQIDLVGYNGSAANNVNIRGGGATNSGLVVGTGGDIFVGQTSTITPGSGNTTHGTCLQDGGRLFLSADGVFSLSLNRSDSGELTNFHRAGVFKGSINITTSGVSYNTSSDARLKDNIVDMTGAIDRVKQLAPKRFNFIEDADNTVDGFLAHEAQAVVPEAVTGTKDEVDDDGNAVMQGIDQSKLVPLLTGALREAIAKIETLETKVAALEAAE